MDERPATHTPKQKTIAQYFNAPQDTRVARNDPIRPKRHQRNQTNQVPRASTTPKTSRHARQWKPVRHQDSQDVSRENKHSCRTTITHEKFKESETMKTHKRPQGSQDGPETRTIAPLLQRHLRQHTQDTKEIIKQNWNTPQHQHTQETKPSPTVDLAVFA